MSVLVTGAAGFIGSRVAERLLAQGERVVGLDVFDDFYDPRIKEANLAGARAHASFHELRGDIRDSDLLAAVPDDVDTIVHLAARPGVRASIRSPELYASVNVAGTLAVLELARARNLRSFVFASSSSVYGERDEAPFAEDDPVDRPISPYAATKRAGELLCHSYHHLHALGVLVLRFFTAYGPRQRPDLAIHRFATLMAQGLPIPVFGDGSAARDYTYVDDIADGVARGLAYVRAHPNEYEIVNLGESRTVTLSEVIDVLGREMGIEPTIERLPMQPGDVSRTWADISKARRLLGYDPRTEFRDGVRAFLSWFEDVAAG